MTNDHIILCVVGFSLRKYTGNGIETAKFHIQSQIHNTKMEKGTF